MSLRLEVVTLFPELFDSLEIGLMGKAQQQGHLSLRTPSPREFAKDRHRSVDDAPYGGGSGMVLMAAPIAEALDRLDAEREGAVSRKILLTPQGAPFRQSDAERLAKLPALTFVCGRYEGFDERVRGLVDEEISLGDFVLLGGEVAALAVIEATARLVPGVLGNIESTEEESHSTGILEYPQYTRPVEYRGEAVPEILRSGNHGAIARWRRKEALRRTQSRRPELLEALELTKLDRALLAELEQEEA